MICMFVENGTMGCSCIIAPLVKEKKKTHPANLLTKMKWDVGKNMGFMSLTHFENLLTKI